MSLIRILVCRVDERNPDHLTEIAAVDLPHVEPSASAAETVLDTLEATTMHVGHAVLRAAGGALTSPDGDPFLYGKADEGFKNGWFVARGG